MASTYRKSLEEWLSKLDVKAERVLDCGGSQLPVKGRTKSWDVQEYLIADLPEPHVGSRKPDIEVDLNIDTLPLSDPSFDLVFCLEVFDYIWNPVGAFTFIYDQLKEGGKAYVSFPAFYPHHNPIEHDALNYKEYGIRRLAEATGLEVVQMIPRRPKTNALQAYFAAEGLRAAKGYDHAVMGWIVEFRK